MQLDRFNSFLQQLQKTPGLQQFGEITAAHRQDGDHWIDAIADTPSDPSLMLTLNTALLKNAHSRKAKSKCTYFPVPELRTVVAIRCGTPPKLRTRDRIQNLIKETLKHSSDEFDAKHDGLTGLLNSRSIEEILKRIATFTPPQAAGDEPKLPRSIGLLALDLDSFKQVNDSYGHEYGDVVLRCFAKRLKDLVTQRNANSADLRLFVGRIGGEEFAVLLDGVVSTNAAKALAEDIRLLISSSVLPTETEWQVITGGASALSLPHPSERKITVSIGISSLVVPGKQTQSSILNLRREADEALHRAKVGGRNIVRSFPEIRDKFGSIIEHHTDTDVVVIDIGSRLNVRQGDEFLVFHPDFTGEKPFIFADGRTKKRLGTYPKLPCGRLIVFDVQTDIAFCNVADDTVDRFPVGSSLEYIPVGSIAHLIPSDRRLGFAQDLNLVPVTKLQNAIEGLSHAGKFAVVVFRLDDVVALQQARGVVFINRALAGLFEAIKEGVPASALIGQLTSETFAVVSTDENVHDLTAAVLANAKSRSGDTAIFGAGLFSSMKRDQLPRDKSKLDLKRALDMARYAALPAARNGEALLELFTPITAVRILMDQRREGKVREARADYNSFKQFGIRNADLENQFGLLELEASNPEAALTALNYACELAPTDNTMSANKAFTQYGLGNFEAAHALFVKIAETDFKFPAVYLYVRAMTAYRAFRQGSISIEQAALAALLKDALEHGEELSSPPYVISAKDLNHALTTLSPPTETASEIASKPQ